ncbi:hypothetical protein AOL_s00215g218 [Orbilia oligospora ATCC 24927]|uniref:GYF domain-containing protein n=2 Tax=Orbilia oligospora TaxID=2813651 RepID=G1XTT9_ARTOA|nr:hypothetical protein AOL_s00215g218 [Orbilia oligospora ATCC 24927]EGX43482.1 hypothetical protein AOL_s00215g218 [Orbilia oligospora ATCC 24927]
MSSRPRPKATAASSRHASAASNTQFDLRNPNTLAAAEQDEDYDAETAAILNFDEISGQSRGVKRNAVNLDGYDSDSSNEGFGGGKEDGDDLKESKKKKKKEEDDDDDDDDMFGGDDDADGEKIGDESGDKIPGKKKKDVRFLDIKDIEGQEDQSDDADSGDDEEQPEEENEEVDEEIGAGGKKKNAPKMDGFNMKAEMEEGRFDDQGNFVRRAVDPDAVHDSWLEGVSKKEMKKAKESHEKREKEAKLRRREEDELITGELVSNLILSLERGETALEALARLNTGKKVTKPKKSWQKKKGRDMDIDGATGKEPEDPKEKERKEQIEKITTAADRLLSRGFNEIYDEPREFLTRLYKKETNEDWVEPVRESAPDETTEVVDEWEYKWSDGQGDGQIHGPYGGTEMKAWKEAGYFQEGVVFRRKGEDESEWTRLPDF